MEPPLPGASRGARPRDCARPANGAQDSHLYALDAATGAPLLAFPIGASTSGPSVSNGRVYIGTGDLLFRPEPGLPAGLPGGVVALGLP